MSKGKKFTEARLRELEQNLNAKSFEKIDKSHVKTLLNNLVDFTAGIKN